MRKKSTKEKNSSAVSETSLMKSTKKKKSANRILKSSKNNKSYSAKTCAKTRNNYARKKIFR